MAIKITNDEILSRFRKVHGNKYDYSNTYYVKTGSKVEIICPIHGSFHQFPSDHTKGCGCPRCGYEETGHKRRHTLNDFIAKAKVIHGDRFDYSNVEYKNSLIKVDIICPIHGSFHQLPSEHLCGKGCNKCGIEKTTKALFDTKEDFLEKANNIHGDKFDYSKVDYIRSNVKIIIGCDKHGDFLQTPNNHINSGAGCPKCACTQRGLDLRSNTDDFIRKSIKKHGQRYIYNNVNYTTVFEPVEILCKKHGAFLQNPNDHLNGLGCKKCSKQYTKPEQYIESILHSHGLDYIRGNRKTIAPYELDFYIPDKNIAIEFDGTYYHSEILGKKDKNYHLMKTEKCDKLGINLIHIFESEYDKNKNKVRNNLKRFLNLEKYEINSDNCEVREISKELKTKFIEKYNLFQNLPSHINYGLFYKNRLIQVMGINYTINDSEYEIYNFSTVNNFKINDGYTKIIVKFENEYRPVTISSYVDRRWDDKILIDCGFYIANYTDPKSENINHVKDKKTIIDRIWDCGNSVYMKTCLTNNPI